MEQVDILRYALRVFDSLSVEYMIVGSLASMAYGEPRMTRDIDIVANLGLAHVDALCDAFPPAEYYVSREAVRQAIEGRHQFNIIHPRSGNKIDVMMAHDDVWGKTQLARRKLVTILPDVIAPTAAPEDVILAKMWYYREGEHEKHLRDIASMLRISPELIDRDYIHQWAAQLGLSDIWQAVLTRVG